MHRLLAGACLLLFGFAAVVPASAGDFKGFYFGGNIGGGKASSMTARTTTVFSPTGYFASSSVPAIATAGVQTLQPSGITGGGQVGYNFQHKSFVFGLEADYGKLNISDKKSTTATYPCCAPTNFTVKQFVGTDWLFTLRPRVGFTGGPVFVYGTGGLAVSNPEYTSEFNDTFATAHENGGKLATTKSGWAAGVGAEFKTSKHFSIKGEYLRVSFGSASTTTSTNLVAFTPRIAFPTNVFTHSVGDLSANVFRAGFNFYF